jgi:hypothetical protein
MNRDVTFICGKLNSDNLSDFIMNFPDDIGFTVHDWLRTLETETLRCIERDAQYCYYGDTPVTPVERCLEDMVDVAIIAYAAEMSYEISTDDVRDQLENLLIGLSVAACVERLRRAGWVTVTDRMGILLEGPKPYKVTKKGLEEGIWSPEPLTLWLLGAPLSIQ